MLISFCSATGCRDAGHGKDVRAVEPMKLRRSVGAEVNWGIRFTCEADADSFLDGLAGTPLFQQLFWGPIFIGVGCKD